MGKGPHANLVWTTSQQPTGIIARRKFGLTEQFLSTSKVTVDLPPSAQQRVYVSCGGPLPMSGTFLNFASVSGTKTRFESRSLHKHRSLCTRRQNGLRGQVRFQFITSELPDMLREKINLARARWSSLLDKSCRATSPASRGHTACFSLASRTGL